MLSTDKKVYQYDTPITITGNNGVGNNGVLFRNNIAIALGTITVGQTIQNEFNSLSYPTDAPPSAYTLLEVTNASTLDLTNSLPTFLADVETVLPRYDFTIVSNQLTTLEKVKLSLGIAPTDLTKDVLLNDFINQVTAYIQTLCGGRTFAATNYTEICDLPDGANVFLSNYPIIMTVPPVVSYRTGTISTPVWVPYTPDDYYVYDKEGYLSFENQFFTGDWQGDKQSLQVVYTAGYLIDWANENNPLLHTLPADLTALATSLVVSMYNRKSTGGIKSESTEGQSIDYGSASDTGALNENQKAVIARYMRHNV